MKLLWALLCLIPATHASYKLTVYLRRLDVGQGFLANGTHCTPTWNIGDQCNIMLKLAVCLGTPDDLSDPCPETKRQPIDLGQVTTNQNAIEFAGGGTAYGAWKNPADFVNTDDGVLYAGFSLYVEARDKQNGLIDSYSHRFDDGLSPNNFEYFSHERVNLEATLFSIAWRASGDLPTPPPPTTTEGPTTTTQSTTSGPSTPEPTTEAPVTAKDCSEIVGGTDGPNQILINNVTTTVYCSFGSNVAITHIQGRGELDFTKDTFAKTYDDYAKPFGTVGKGNNYWLGLDNINVITNSGDYSLFIEVCCGTKSVTQQIYKSATVGTKNQQYMLNASATINTGLNVNDAGNAYGRDLGRPFHTYAQWAQDGTQDEEYCAVINYSKDEVTAGSGGWWFGNCGENLNGAYYELKDLNPDTCEIPTDLKAKGTGIELITKVNPTITEPLYDKRSYTRARMGLYKGSGQPLGLKDYCLNPRDETSRLILPFANKLELVYVMRGGLRIAALFLAIAIVPSLSYQLTIQLQSLSLTGNLADGKPCSQLSAFGIKCYPLVAICVQTATDETSDPSTCQGEDSAWFDLGVTPATNEINWDPGFIKGWFNPQTLKMPGNFPSSPYFVKLRVQHYYGTTVKQIDNALWKIDQFTPDKDGGTVATVKLNDRPKGQIENFIFEWTYDGISGPTTAAPSTTSAQTTTGAPQQSSTPAGTTQTAGPTQGTESKPTGSPTTKQANDATTSPVSGGPTTSGGGDGVSSTTTNGAQSSPSTSDAKSTATASPGSTKDPNGDGIFFE
ncbi:unnamed protein product, partial [Mesorhabditis spiculigera]